MENIAVHPLLLLVRVFSGACVIACRVCHHVKMRILCSAGRNVAHLRSEVWVATRVLGTLLANGGELLRLRSLRLPLHAVLGARAVGVGRNFGVPLSARCCGPCGEIGVKIVARMLDAFAMLRLIPLIPLGCGIDHKKPKDGEARRVYLRGGHVLHLPARGGGRETRKRTATHRRAARAIHSLFVWHRRSLSLSVYTYRIAILSPFLLEYDARSTRLYAQDYYCT